MGENQESETVKRFRESFDCKEEIRQARRRAGVEVITPPRYDDIFFEGVARLDRDNYAVDDGMARRKAACDLSMSILKAAEKERIEFADREASCGVQYEEKEIVQSHRRAGQKPFALYDEKYVTISAADWEEVGTATTGVKK